MKDTIRSHLYWGSLVAQLVKNPPAMQETWVRSLGWEDPLEKGKATHSSIVAGEFRGYSPWGRTESDMTERLSLHFTSVYNLRKGAAAAKSLQSCPTLCDPIDGSPPGSPVPGILQARTLAWVAIIFSSAWKWKLKRKSLGRVRLLATPWTASHQAPPSMGLSRQEYWSRVPLPSPEKGRHFYKTIWDFWLLPARNVIIPSFISYQCLLVILLHLILQK